MSGHLALIVSMKTHTDNCCQVVMYELFVFILINSTTLIIIIIIYNICIAPYNTIL